LQTCFADSARDFPGDIFEMWSLATDDRSDANDRIKLLRFGEPQSQQGDLKSAGDSENFNLFLVHAQALESVESSFDEARADEVVPATGDNRKTKSLTIKMSFVNYCLQERFGSLSCLWFQLANHFEV
jgi:hypothetical protein